MNAQWVSTTRAANDLPGIVVQERVHAVDKFDVQHHDIDRWMCIIGEEFGEAQKEANELWFLRNRGITNVDGNVDPRIRSRLRALTKELAQTAAMCIHAICDLEGYPVDCDDMSDGEFPIVVHGHDAKRWWEVLDG